jgi:hypothetical protein
LFPPREKEKTRKKISNQEKNIINISENEDLKENEKLLNYLNKNEKGHEYFILKEEDKEGKVNRTQYGRINFGKIKFKNEDEKIVRELANFAKTAGFVGEKGSGIKTLTKNVDDGFEVKNTGKKYNDNRFFGNQKTKKMTVMDEDTKKEKEISISLISFNKFGPAIH